MNELKATPGPYAVETMYTPPKPMHRGNTVRIYSTDPGPAQEFHLGYATNMDMETRDANAHLLAASWELYQALKMLLEDIQDYQRINHLGGESNASQVLARAALAKARGEQ